MGSHPCYKSCLKGSSWPHIVHHLSLWCYFHPLNHNCLQSRDLQSYLQFCPLLQVFRRGSPLQIQGLPSVIRPPLCKRLKIVLVKAMILKSRMAFLPWGTQTPLEKSWFQLVLIVSTLSPPLHLPQPLVHGQKWNHKGWDRCSPSVGLTSDPGSDLWKTSRYLLTRGHPSVW